MKYVLYCRKSSEDSDRQVQSVQDQKNVMQNIAKERGLEIVKVFEENRSAKCPGRSEFNKMLDYIHKGKAHGILTWKLDRLARNPLDGGSVIWMLQQSVLKKIITNDREYRSSDNVLMMSVEFGMANQFVLDLSKNVRRGMRSKCEKGWRPGVAPIGYLNDLREKKIIKDPERFDLIRKMWDLMLTGCYTPGKIASKARKDWGLTSVPKQKSGGVLLSRTTAYKILKNPFYCGEFKYGGEVFVGSHEPMITKAEYDKVQKILGRNGNPRAKNKEFAYTGLLKCSECGCSITAEEKTKYNKRNNEIKSYIYYHCTKKKGHCGQKSIEEKELEKQAKQILDKIELSDKFLNWVQKNLEKETKSAIKERIITQRRLENELNNQVKRLDNLIKLKISASNTDGSLLSDVEFITQKNEIISLKNDLLNSLKKTDSKQNQYVDVTAKVFDFCKIAKGIFKKGKLEDKRLILRCLGSNFTLKDKELSLELRKVFQEISDDNEKNNRKHGRLEPNKTLYRKVIKAVQDDFVSSGCELGRMLELFFSQIKPELV